MSTGPEVLAQLAKAMHAHRTAHHGAVRRARVHRQKRQADEQGLPADPASVAEPEPAGMPAGLPPQDVVSGLFDLGATDV